MDTDGAVRRTTGGRVHSPSWSPDGARIAFSGFGAGHSQIQTIAVADDGVGATVVVDRQGRNETPAWSPDGDAMLFVSDWTAFDFAYDIYVTTSDGSGITQLTDGFPPPDMTRYQHPAWSPDGSTIAFVYGSYPWNGSSPARLRVALVSADGAFVRDLAWAGDITWFDADYPGPGSLTWSPDGRGIAYEFIDCDLFAGSGCSNERSVKYVSIDGSQSYTIVENARSPSWRR
jgi:Tol biopolymer transport system component